MAREQCSGHMSGVWWNPREECSNYQLHSIDTYFLHVYFFRKPAHTSLHFYGSFDLSTCSFVFYKRALLFWNFQFCFSAWPKTIFWKILAMWLTRRFERCIYGSYFCHDMASFFPGWFTSCCSSVHDSITVCCTDYKYTKGRFKCYVTQWGGSASAEKKKCYEGVWFNVISVMRGGWGSNFQGENTRMAPIKNDKETL